MKNSIKIIEVIIETNTDFYKNNRNVTRKNNVFYKKYRTGYRKKIGFYKKCRNSNRKREISITGSIKIIEITNSFYKNYRKAKILYK